MKSGKILPLILIILFAISSCGKKGNLKYPGEQKRPKFDNVIDE